MKQSAEKQINAAYYSNTVQQASVKTARINKNRWLGHQISYGIISAVDLAEKNKSERVTI